MRLRLNLSVMNRYHITIVGGGIVGLATAMHLSSCFPRYKILLLEKERKVGLHQTSHNSGVIHSGIYYPPGSLKAKLCVNGMRALIDFAQQNSIPYESCGKVIVATNEKEVLILHSLYERGKTNGVSK